LKKLVDSAAAAGGAERAKLLGESMAILNGVALDWEVEMEMAKALGRMPQGAWLAPSRDDRGLPVLAPARTKNALVERVREIWSRVLDAEKPETWAEPFAPVAVLAAADYETSGVAEMKAGNLDVEAAFGLPHSLADRKSARDRYRWSYDEERELKADVSKQRWQFTISDRGVSRVELAESLAGERKLGEDALAGLASLVGSASEVLGGAPSVVWGMDGDDIRILWVMDVRPPVERREAARGETARPSAAPEPASPQPQMADDVRLPVTATRLFASCELGAATVGLERAQGVLPLSVDAWLKANILAHPLSREGGGLESLGAGLASALESHAKAVLPRPVIASLSNLTSEEFAAMPGGERFEPEERNPMLGFRGGARHLSAGNEGLLEAELSAVADARRRGARNLSLALPFVRTTDELSALNQRVRSAGLERGQDFKLWMFADVPSNVFLVEQFAALCDGIAIRIEPLHHLMAAVDPGSPFLADAGYARLAAEGSVKAVARVISGAHSAGRQAALCGDRLHESPELLDAAVREGVDAVSTAPGRTGMLARVVAATEQRILLESAARQRAGGRP
jgi:hypothetical protein